jgi:hypothetical protein
MFNTIIIILLDVIGTTVYVICAAIARIAQCLMK